MTEVSDDINTSAGTYETKAEASKSGAATVERWLAEISLADRTQKEWRKEAQDARDMFRSEGAHASQRFNIQYSNVATMMPALYSSRPTPDVRKRYADKAEKEGAARIAAQIIERNLAVSMDSYDFDGIMRSVVQNALLTGRGLPRVRHKPITSGQHVFNRVEAESVPWRDLVLGPCEVWEDCPWLAFKHLLTREQLIKLNPKLGLNISLNHMIEGASPEDSEKAPNVFKRCEVWEIIDRETGKVLWITDAHKAEPLSEEDDPFELIDFWPVPKPYYFSDTTDTMVPMVPAKIVKPLIEELEKLTERIQKITAVIKWRGFADPSLGIDALENAEDGQLVPVGENILQLVQSGGLEKHIWLMPIEQAVQVVVTLNEQREVVKQLIFEVTGISDVIRGATDARETLGAQELKANFGTLRIQDQQKMVQRMVRDTLRIKAEIICSKFEMSELLRNAGMTLPTMLDKQIAMQRKQQMEAMAQQPGPDGQPQQAPPEDPQIEEVLSQPSVEEVEAIIRDDMVRAYVIDIETDSTVQQDMRQVQGNMSAFLEGTASFLSAIGPMVQAGQLSAEAAIDLYQPFARSFHLGKQAEDALERMAEEAKEQSDQPPAPDPVQMEMEKVKAELEAAQQKHQMDMQAAQAKAQADVEARQMQAQAMAQERQFKQEMAEMEFAQKARMYDLDYQQKSRMSELEAKNKAQQPQRQKERA